MRDIIEGTTLLNANLASGGEVITKEKDAIRATPEPRRAQLLACADGNAELVEATVGVFANMQFAPAQLDPNDPEESARIIAQRADLQRAALRAAASAAPLQAPAQLPADARAMLDVARGVAVEQSGRLQEARAAAARSPARGSTARGSPASARGSTAAAASTAPAAAASPARRRLSLSQPVVGERRVNAAVQAAVLAEQQR